MSSGHPRTTLGEREDDGNDWDLAEPPFTDSTDAQFAAGEMAIGPRVPIFRLPPSTASVPSKTDAPHRGMLARACETIQSATMGTSKHEMAQPHEPFSEAQYLLRENNTLADENDILRQKVGERKNGKKNLEELLGKAGRRVETAEESLEACAEQIIRLQPVEAVPDTEISQQYQQLCKAIEHWVDRQLSRVDGILPCIEWFTGRTDVLSGFNDYLLDGELGIIKEAAAAEDSMARYLIHRHLHKWIIARREFHDSLSEGQHRLLDFIDTGMRKLEPRRDEHAINTWRADVMRVLDGEPQLAARSRKTQEAACDVIESIFQGLLEAKEGIRQPKRSCMELVGLATAFKNAINFSPSNYLCEYDFAAQDPAKVKSLFSREFEDFTIIDANNGQIVRSLVRVQEDRAGRMGRKLCVIHPALRREDPNTGSTITLVRPTILARVFRNGTGASRC